MQNISSNNTLYNSEKVIGNHALIEDKFLQSYYSFKIVNPYEFAKIILELAVGKEISFATWYETDRCGLVIPSSLEEWHGMKIIEEFDGKYLLCGVYGGGDWYSFDLTSPTSLAELIEITQELFNSLGVETICIETQKNN